MRQSARLAHQQIQQTMHLKRLEIEGFKTFASQTVLEFQPGIAAIVGPNGSGKSNISDAIRWVLGEQSYTALRCKRSEELLFSGSENRAPSPVAEVSLTIDNSDRLLPLDFTEVTITRRVIRGGGNEYLLNRAKVRLRDIQEATEPLGSSYTIINQGLVDLALTLRPEDRRRLFEQAAELGSFEARRDEAERRLAETETNMQRIADLLSELEPRLRSLKRQANQARQYEETSAELQRLLLHDYADQWQAAHAGLQAAEQRIASLQTEREQMRQTQAQATAELQALGTAFQQQRSHVQALQQEQRAHQTRIETARRMLTSLRDRLTGLRQRLDELATVSAELAASQAEAAREMAAVRELLASAQAERATQQARLEECTIEAASYEAERRAMEEELAAAQAAALQADTAAAAQRNRIEHLATQRERLVQDQAKLATTLRQAEEQTAAATTAAEAATAAAAAAETARSAAAQAEASARTQVETLRRERSTAEDTLAAARRTLTDLQARLDALNRLAHSYTGSYPGVKAAMQWAERSGRTGFALVASVLRVPGQLETAIEVALGGRLQNIVVEVWQDAEDAIAELKRSRAGRATFLPLDTLRRNEPRNPLSGRRQPVTDAVFGVAADLVEYDDHYQPVAQHLLGRTLIVRDLPTARHELRQLTGGWQLVTLAGEQVSSGGAVTGGAQTRETGTLQRERELRELPLQVEDAQATVAETTAQSNILAAELAQATERLHTAEANHQAAHRQEAQQRGALESASRQAEQARQDVIWRRERYEAATRDLATLDEQETALLNLGAEAAAHAAAAQTHLDELRTHQQTASQSDRVVQERLASLRTAAAEAEAQVRAQQALLAAHQQTHTRLERQQAEAEQRRTTLATECAQLEADEREVAATVARLLAEEQDLQARIAPLDAELQQANARHAELSRHEQQANAALRDHETACARADLELQRAHDRIETLHARAAADGLDLGATPQTAEQPARPLPADLPAEIERLRERLRRFGAVNSLAPEEYAEAAERHTFLQTQLDDLRQASATLRELIGELEAAMHRRFVQTFQAVAVEFERYFTRLFGGGTARLQLVNRSGGAVDEQSAAEPDADHPAPSPTSKRGKSARTVPVGIEITARPPGKRQQNLSLLSGGERALTASALLFALLSVNPSPFCVMDEVDAALDESNVGRFREALAGLTNRTQFILISHNRGTIEAAGTLYGVTMGEDGVSRVLSLQVEAAPR